jgi:hypothetical protein
MSNLICNISICCAQEKRKKELMYDCKKKKVFHPRNVLKLQQLPINLCLCVKIKGHHYISHCTSQCKIDKYSFFKVPYGTCNDANEFISLQDKIYEIWDFITTRSISCCLKNWYFYCFQRIRNYQHSRICVHLTDIIWNCNHQEMKYLLIK